MLNCFGRVLKRSLSAHNNASKVTFIHILFEWRIACSFYGKTVWSNGCQIFGQFAL